ncbi:MULTISPECIES: DegV family protein [unclassified Actinopolyspora]|uniref:DegV family protein n=1 Tax=unclassified Actinopolyspora TaxID=2639451 RepID=UPI0013F5E9C2|nr:MULTISPECIES: DegV family protein [unclassified Actinopolyspora]NHD18789.1 DegV family EDD domain-containing protein [Actinopolyspora sp. BKK2]NHE77889.1 DegV family EDD domain-containing protein [Actinopolyspora sp. BKK1]
MNQRVAIVTDSTASIPAHLVERLGISVVQLELTVGEESNDERRVPHDQLAEAMRSGQRVATAAPPPPAFFWNYSDAISEGVEAVISAHISTGLSQTCASARTAAAEFDTPIHVVDSSTCCLGLGYAVIAAAETAAAGADVRTVLDVLNHRLGGSSETVYVDTLEHLRRGGRIGAAKAGLGSALSLKPVLGLREGVLTRVGQAVGTERAVRKAVDVAARNAGTRRVNIAAEHFQAEQRAGAALEELRNRVETANEPILAESSAAIGAHTGPGSVVLSVTPA